MRYIKHLFVAFCALVAVVMSARWGSAGLDMIQGHMIPATPACVVTASDEPVWIVGASTAGFTPTATGNIDDFSYICFEIE